MTKQHVLASTNCPKCGNVLDGNGKNCINCNTKEGHQLIRDTLSEIFNKDFEEKYRAQCHWIAGYVIVPGAILCLVILWLLGTYFNPVLLVSIPHSPYSEIAMAFSGFIFYPVVFFLKKNSLRRKFIESQFKGDSK